MVLNKICFLSLVLVRGLCSEKESELVISDGGGVILMFNILVLECRGPRSPGLFCHSRWILVCKYRFTRLDALD